MASFTFRRSVLTQPETWKTNSEGLTVSYDGIHESLCVYQNLKSVRLFYFPTRMKTNNYVCEMDFLNPPSKMKISSVSYVSFANFEDKAIEYNEFIKNLALNVSQQNPNCKFYAGKPIWKFVLEHILVVLIIAAIIFSLSFIGAFSASAMVVIKLCVVAFSLFYIVKAFRANWPREISATNIPSKVLPSS